MNFTLKFSSKLKEAWVLYKDNLWNFIFLTIVTLAISFISQDNNFLLIIISNLLSLLVAYVWFQSISNLLDGKGFTPFSKESLPSLAKYWNIFKTMILLVIIFLGGLILLIVPGLYFMGRLIFAFYIAIEEPNGARNAIKKSWNMTEGYGWKFLGYGILIGLFMALGFIALFVGSFITYPLGLMILIIMYRDFKKFRENNPIKEAEIVKEEQKPEEIKNEEVKKEDLKEEVKEEKTETSSN